MKSSKQYDLKGEVQVDEFFIGGPEEQKRGRSKETISCGGIRKSRRWCWQGLCSSNRKSVCERV